MNFHRRRNLCQLSTKYQLINHHIHQSLHLYADNASTSVRTTMMPSFSIIEGGKYKFVDESEGTTHFIFKLTVIGVVENDYGEYKCEVTNSRATDSQIVTLSGTSKYSERVTLNRPKVMGWKCKQERLLKTWLSVKNPNVYQTVSLFSLTNQCLKNNQFWLLSIGELYTC